MARTDPMIVASSPMARCRKPPILALAYISPARSSKRRMSIIACSHSCAASFSGSCCRCSASTLIHPRRYSRFHHSGHCLNICPGGVGRELPRNARALQRPVHGLGMDLARRGGNQERVGVVEIAAGGEGLTEGGQREGDGPADLL